MTMFRRLYPVLTPPGKRGDIMAELELKFSATLKNAQLGTVAAAQICKELYRLASAEQSFETGKDAPADVKQFMEDVEICVGEACTNAVRYGPKSDQPTRHVIVTFTIESTPAPETEKKPVRQKIEGTEYGKDLSMAGPRKRLLISVKDQNGKFDFDNVPEVDFEAFQESGYGIFIMKEKMDQVVYQHLDGWNIVTMIKEIR